jgi:hypothetical protein
VRRTRRLRNRDHQVADGRFIGRWVLADLDDGHLDDRRLDDLVDSVALTRKRKRLPLGQPPFASSPTPYSNDPPSTVNRADIDRDVLVPAGQRKAAIRDRVLDVGAAGRSSDRVARSRNLASEETHTFDGKASRPVRFRPHSTLPAANTCPRSVAADVTSVSAPEGIRGPSNSSARFPAGFDPRSGGGELSLDEFTSTELKAIERTQLIFDSVYDLDVERATMVEQSEYAYKLSRVEVDTIDGHLCIYFQDEPVGTPAPADKGNGEGLYLLSIERGSICAELIYSALS